MNPDGIDDRRIDVRAARAGELIECIARPPPKRPMLITVGELLPKPVVVVTRVLGRVRADASQEPAERLLPIKLYLSNECGS
jgi:hypothetical protein